MSPAWSWINHGWKITASLLLVMCCAFDESRRYYYKDQVAVLVYHHLDEQLDNPGTVSPSLFRKQLTHLQEKGYRFITYRQFREFFNGSPVPTNAVLVTFDDGYRSYYSLAYPILKALSIPAVQFVITKDLDNPTASRIVSLSREEIGEMAEQREQFEFQCHTDKLHDKHKNKALLISRMTIDNRPESEEEYARRVVQDTGTCLSKLAPLQTQPVDSLAYPFGIYNDTVVELVRKNGIQYAFTVQPGLASTDVDPLQIPRINAGSPWITPDSLHHAIVSQIATFRAPLDQVPLRTVVQQLGGTVVKEGDGAIHIYMGKKRWRLTMDGHVVKPNGETMSLSEPLVLKNRRMHINIHDLQRMLGESVVYDTNTKRYYLNAAQAAE